MSRNLFSNLALGLTAALCITLVGCASMPTAQQVAPPTPIADNSGAYLSPYLADGSEAPWVGTVTTSDWFGERFGRAAEGAGARAGERLGGRLGGLGALAGRAAGEVAARNAAHSASRAAIMELLGGEERMREQSELSFNDVNDYIVWLYGVHSERRGFDRVYQVTTIIYPEVDSAWKDAIRAAPRR